MGFIIFKILFDRHFPYPKKTADNKIDPFLAPTGEQIKHFNIPKKEHFATLPFEQIEIISFDGLRLAGRLLRGTQSHETVVCVHGYKSSPEGDFCGIIEIYLKRGCHILLVDDRAHGASQGRYVSYGELDRFDVCRWCDKMLEMFPSTNIVLHGVSMGAETVLFTANMPLPANVKAIISDCGFTSISEITKHLSTKVFKLPYFPLGPIVGFFASYIAHVQFNKTNAEKCLRETKLAISIISGSDDQYVPRPIPMFLFFLIVFYTPFHVSFS